MLNEICAHLRNYFDTTETGDYISIKRGSFVVANGAVSPLPSGVNNGQYIRIVGSLFNDGIHLLPAIGLVNESFKGAVFALAIPAELVALDAEIDAFVAQNVASPYVSESFGGYSYTKSTDANGAAISWQGAFRSRLDRWRKV